MAWIKLFDPRDGASQGSNSLTHIYSMANQSRGAPPVNICIGILQNLTFAENRYFV